MHSVRKHCNSTANCLKDVNGFKKLTVKFQIADNESVAQVYPSCMLISDIKFDLAQKFEIDADHLVICQEGQEVKDTLYLSELQKNDYDIVEVSLKVDEDENEQNHIKLNTETYYKKYKLPDFITVSIPNENNPNCPCNRIIVEIENAAIKKPFIGGHRDLRTGKDYFDAFTQTGPPLEKIKHEGVYSRDAQTVQIRSDSINTAENHAAQVFGDASKLIYIPSANDYTIEAKPYETYEEKVKREDKIGKIILIQRNLRRYILWKFIRAAAAQYRALRAEQERREKVIINRQTNKLRQECVTKTFPKTKEDFDLLFAQVQRWKDAEIKRINSMYSDGPRIAELHCLLDKEVQLLSGIEKQRILVKKALKDFRDEQNLKKLGEPVKWIGYQNVVVEMDLLRTQRVRYLTELYKSMKKNSKKEDRLSLISKLNQVLRKEMDEKPKLSSAILELLDLLERERNLLLCTRMNNCTLDTLRKRQGVLFTEIIQFEDEYMPEKPESKMCEKCKIVKPVNNFALRTRQSSVDICKTCHYMRGTASDNSTYKSILRSIQRDERKRKTLASYAFIIQEDDIRFIVDKIWHGHSILSKCNDLANLRLPRWIKSEDWSPWNCICLTEDEARAHENLENLNNVYQAATIQDIRSKHLLAKSAFKKLFDVDTDFVETGRWRRTGID